MTIQYLSDSRGVKQMVQVQIPIKEWEKAGHRMLIEDNEATTKPKFSKAKLKLLNGIKEALEEVELHRQGKIQLQDAKDFINEL